MAKIDLFRKDLTALEGILLYEKDIKHTGKSNTIMTKHGELTIFHSEPDEFVLYRIYLHTEFQRKGILTGIIKHFQDDINYNRICVCASEGATESCLRKIIHNGRPFINHGGDFIWSRSGDYCKCHYYDSNSCKLVNH